MDADTSVPGDTSAAPPAAPPAVEPIPAAVPDTGTASGTDQTPPALEPAIPAIGPVPYDRFKQVNTRMQDAERKFNEMQRSYGDVLAIPADQARQVAAFARRMQADPVAAAIELSEQLMAHPQYGPQMASQAARWLQSRRGQGQGTPSAPDPEPEPDLVAESGQPVYSAPRLREWKAWADKQTEARISQRLEPLERDARTRQQREQQDQIRQRADTEAGAILEKAKSWHGFETHQESILAAFKEHQDWSLQDAYLHILHSEILPALSSTEQSKVVAQLQQKAAAQTLNPGGGSPTQKPDFGGDFAKALTYFAGKK